MNETTGPEEMIERLNLLEKKQPWYKNRYLPYIVSFLFLILFLATCQWGGERGVSVARLEGKLWEMEKQASLREIQFSKIQDSLAKDNKEKDKIISQMEYNHKQDSISLIKLSKKKTVALQKVKQLSTPNEYTYWFQDRYAESKDSIVETLKGVEMQGTVPEKIALELTAYDFTKEELQIKDKTIGDFKIQVTNLNGKITNKDIEIKNGEILLKDQKDINETQKDLIDDKNSEIGKLKVRATAAEYMVPAGIILGFLGGVLLVK